MPESGDLSSLRAAYSRAALDESSAHDDPMAQFRQWFAEAVAADIPEPNACTLATVGSDGRPAARVILLKGFDDHGFVFYTNYESRKARELESSGHAALVFWWAGLERQVRIEGAVDRVSDKESETYFAERPRGSQLGAWASAQSRWVASRVELEDQLASFERRFENQPVPRPPQWGGYRITPACIEFWQGRPDRLHDRLLYVRGESDWAMSRLAP